MTSVESAVSGDNGRVLHLLLSSPQQLQDRDLQQGLFTAVKEGKVAFAKQILDVLTSLDASNLIMYLKQAVVGQNPEMCQTLLKAGCDVNAFLPGSSTILHFAAQMSAPSCMHELLRANPNLEVKNSSGCTPFLLAAKNCRRGLSNLSSLIEAGCNVNAVDKTGRSALHYCSHQGFGFEMLLKAGSLPDIQDEDQNTAMHLAALEGFDMVVESLLEHHADPNLANRFGKLPIHYLAMKNHWRGINAICKSGGNCEVSDNEGHSPIYLAVEHNRPLAVKALLTNNCDPNNKKNSSPEESVLWLSLEQKLFDIAKLLVLAGANVQPLYPWVDEVKSRIEAAELNNRPTLMNPAPRESTNEEELLPEIKALDWFKDWINEPHSLKQLCRLFIRTSLGLQFRFISDQLPLPKALLEYVTLKEVGDEY